MRLSRVKKNEHLEEAFHPQVNDPPAPVLNDRKVGMLSPVQSGAVEEANGPGGEHEDPQQVTLVAGILQCGTDGAHHQE
jgi:hypothetical protein